MRDQALQERHENRDRLRSGLITAAVWSAILLFLFWYKVVEKLPEKKEVETRMLINFGDRTNGNGQEEPANHEGSMAPKQKSTPEEEPAKPAEKIISKKTTPPVEKSVKETFHEKMLVGNNEKKSVNPTENFKKDSKKSVEKPSTGNKKPGSKDAAGKTKTGAGDAKGTAAIGNLLKGRGTKNGSQGTGAGSGNNGDPLGGAGNGDSKIGIDRKLIGYIPGTMGRGGKQPPHDCDASGNITISYTVDKAGNVVSAHRSGGISDPCVVSTSLNWVKKFVKAERATSYSTGIYRITF